MIRRVVYLLQQGYDARNHDRFGVDLMRRNGFVVEVWDLTSAFWPSLPTTTDEMMAQYSFVRRFTDRKEALRAVRALDPDTFVLCFVEYLDETVPLYQALSRASAAYGVGVMNALPPFGAGDTARSHLSRLLGFAKRPEALASLIARARRVFRRGIKPAAFVIAGGSDSVASIRYPTDARTRIVWAHSMDYDVMLQDGAGGTSTSGTAVFLDEFRPFHPDYIYATSVSPPAPESYFASLRRFFCAFEQQTDLRVEIAAHPRSDYERRPDYFDGRPAVRGRTLAMVRMADVVITHLSTAVNFAVALRKPILLITTSHLARQRDAGVAATMAALLCRSVIDIDAPGALDRNWLEESRVADDCYADYERRFIKTPESREAPLWQIVADELRSGSEAHFTL